jgi:NAD-dependent deacetylase
MARGLAARGDGAPPRGAGMSGAPGGAANGPPLRDALAAARATLARARRVVVFTGAGVSAESGVPTFRGAGGLWKEFKPEDLATPIAFGRDPRLVWEWYGWRREAVARCPPNAAHLALARWMLTRAGVTLVSQNVDDLHERAARAVAGDAQAARRAEPVRLHGSLFHDHCTRCTYRGEARGAVDATSIATLPHCPECGGLLRPDVVWFGEMLPARAVEVAFAAAGEADACLVIGTTGAVYPAAGVVHAAKAVGARVVVVDPGQTEYEGVADIRLCEAAGEVVPQILG